MLGWNFPALPARWTRKGLSQVSLPLCSLPFSEQPDDQNDRLITPTHTERETRESLPNVLWMKFKLKMCHPRGHWVSLISPVPPPAPIPLSQSPCPPLPLMAATNRPPQVSAPAGLPAWPRGTRLPRALSHQVISEAPFPKVNARSPPPNSQAHCPCAVNVSRLPRPWADRGWLSPSNPSPQEPSAEEAARTNSGIWWSLMWGLTDPFEKGCLRLPEKNSYGTLCTDSHTHGAWGWTLGGKTPYFTSIKICQELQILFT